MTNRQRERLNLLKAKLFVYRAVAQVAASIARRKDISNNCRSFFSKQSQDSKENCKKVITELQSLKSET